MVRLLQEREDFRQKAVMSYVKAGMEIYAVLQEPDICNFCKYFINSIIAFRDFFFDLQQSEKWSGEQQNYYIETDKELFNSVESGEKGKGYTLEQCGKMEIRDVVAEEFMICFIHADETYRQMAHRDLLEGTFPEKENEIEADGFVLSNLGFSGNLGDYILIFE